MKSTPKSCSCRQRQAQRRTGERVVEHDRPPPPTDESTLLEIARVAEQ